MDNYTYIYKVNFHDCIEMKSRIEYGIFYASTYGQATEYLAECYGEDEIIDLELKCIDNTPIILSEYWYNNIKESNENKIM